MAGRYLLDTNIVIALFAGDDGVRERLSSAGEFFLPTVVVGELLYGALCSKNSGDNIEKVNRFLASMSVLPCDSSTAVEYAGIKRNLRERGKMIPENDAWIAATASQHGITLVTRDAHFEEVGAISKESW